MSPTVTVSWTPGNGGWTLAQRRAHGVAVLRQLCAQGAADEAGSARDQNARHDATRASLDLTTTDWPMRYRAIRSHLDSETFTRSLISPGP